MGGAAVARGSSSQLPHAELELMADAGHAPWIDDPDQVADRAGPGASPVTGIRAPRTGRR